MRAGTVIRTALFTALVFVATVVLQVYVPATRGYFNLGETAIYTIAAISPPLVAGFAGGVGSAIADLVTGYGVFAPGTLVIKGVEGALVAYLIRRLYSARKGVGLARALSVVTSVLAGFLIALIGYTLLSGVVELTSVPIAVAGFKAVLASGTVTLSGVVWVVVGVVVAVILLYSTLVKGRENIIPAASMLSGGMVMVLGYLLYQYFYSNPVVFKAPPEQALLEVPVNVGQALVGMSFALSVTSFVKEAVGSGGSATRG